MDVGISFANIGRLGGPEGAAALGEACDEHGVESVWTVEHVVVPAGYESTYPYSRDGRMPGGEQSPIPDPLIWLTWVGAHSREVLLGTGVLILPQRNPVVLAKEVSTLDQLSGGRVQLGIGVGWLEEEFDAIGVSFAERGARTDEYVAAMRELWGSEEPTFEGRFTSFDKALSNPKPVRGSVPIVVGGHTEIAARRAGRLGDGFFPAKYDDLGRLLEVMRAAADAAGRDADAIEVSTGAPRDPAGLVELERLGVTRVVIPPPALTPDEIGPAIARTMDQLKG